MSEHQKCLLYYQNQYSESETWTNKSLHSRNSFFPLCYVHSGMKVSNLVLYLAQN